jgi:hypothetical protein
MYNKQDFSLEMGELCTLYRCTTDAHTHTHTQHTPLNLIEQRYTFVVEPHLQSNPTVLCMIFDQFQI